MTEIVGELVWVKAALPKGGRSAAVAEKWPLNPIDATKRDKTVLARHPLSAREWPLAIAILEQRFPAPTIEAAP